MYNIVHLSDIHVHNLKFNNIYKIIFTQLFEKLRNIIKPDVIVITGDTAHSKATLSPEYFSLCSWILKECADICKTIIILGNHDGLLRNSERMDAITPILNSLNHPNLFLLKNSGEFEFAKDLTFNVLSIFDRENWKLVPSDDKKINIALYHGAISGCRSDNNWIMEYGDDNISIFDNFDYAMLGDIHLSNQKLDEAGTIRYAGSTIQQNFSEEREKGFLLWKIEDKKKFDVEMISFDNPQPFISINLTDDGKLPDIDVQEGANIRLISPVHVSLNQQKKLQELAKFKFKPEKISFINNKDKNTADIEKAQNRENISDIYVQEKLITEYLKDFAITDDTLRNIFELNRKFETLVNSEEEQRRNVSFEILEMKWNNFFKYGPNNTFDFQDKKGIVGIFGKSYSGKSSIIDIMTYLIYGDISKPARKYVNIINDNANEASGVIRLKIDNDVYVIERKLERVYKKGKNDEETEDARTFVSFSKQSLTGETENLNGQDVDETKKNIRNIFGSLDDFLLTSLSSQLEALSFIKEKSTERKTILGRFLNLEMFAKKYNLANKEAKEKRVLLKRLEGKDFLQEIQEKEQKFAEKSDQIAKYTKKTNTLSEQSKTAEKELETIKQNLIKIEESDDISIILLKKEEKNNKITEYKKLIETNCEKLKENNDSLKTNEEEFEKLVDYSTDLRHLTSYISQSGKDIVSLKKDIEHFQNILKNYELRPCENQFLTVCPYIKDINKDVLSDLNQKLDKAMQSDISLKEKYETKNEETNKKINFSKKIQNIKADITFLKQKNKELEAKVKLFENELENISKQETFYYENKENIEKNKEINIQVAKKHKQLVAINDEWLGTIGLLRSADREIGSLEQKIVNLKQEYVEYTTLQKTLHAYELYLNCVHPSGISYEIIKKTLPFINNKISEILENIDTFKIFLKDDDNRLDFYIQHTKDSRPRLIEIGSGTEKTLAAFVFRVALLTISSLPRSDLFLLDEPATFFDAEVMDGFAQSLEILKKEFKAVILISHLEALKENADTIINVSSDSGFSRLE